MEDFVAILIAALVGIPFIVFVIAFTSIVRGYVLHILWGWFMVDTFHLPPLGIASAIGVSLTLNYLLANTYTPPKTAADAPKKTLSQTMGELISLMISPFVTLLFGWVIHRFFL